MQHFPLHILIFSQSPSQVQALKKAARDVFPQCLFTVAATEKQYRERLHWMDYNLIIVSFNPANELSLLAWSLANIIMPFVPFIYTTDDLSGDETIDQHRVLDLADGLLSSKEPDRAAHEILRVWAANAPAFEQENNYRLTCKKRKLLLQKFEARLNRNRILPRNAFWRTILASLYSNRQDTASSGK